MKKSNNILQEIFYKQTSAIEVFIVAVILALGINLISDSLPQLFDWSNEPKKFIFLGIMCCLMVLLFFLRKLLREKSHAVEFEGFFAETKSNSIAEIPGYEFNNDFKRYIEAASNEDEAIEIIFKKREDPKIENKNGHISFRFGEETQRKHQMIEELIEYFVLEKLSTHLTDFFNKEKYADEKLQEFRREHISEIVLSNRFLNIFSKPMSERGAFLKEDRGDTKNDFGDGAVCWSQSTSGAVFSRFDLELPKGSKIGRGEDGVVFIDSPRFRLKISPVFQGFSTSVPKGFLEYLLGQKKIDEINFFHTAVKLEVNFKLSGILSVDGWEYYEWLSSFITSFEKSFSMKAYFRRTAWEAIYVAMEATKKLLARSKNGTDYHGDR